MSSLEELKQAVQTLEQRLLKMEGGLQASSADQDAAKAVLSGALPRQRIHWSQEINNTNRLAVLGTIGIWTICLRTDVTDWRVAWAGALSSLLVGLWRWNVRYLDSCIAELYPRIRHYEQALGIEPQNSALLSPRVSDVDELRRLVNARRAGTRGHLAFDWAALIGIGGMAVAVVMFGEPGELTCCGTGPFHPYVLLLLNVLGAGLVVYAMNAYQRNKRARFKPSEPANIQMEPARR